MNTTRYTAMTSTTHTPDFSITSSGEISLAFLEKEIHTFGEALAFIRQLAYGRNADKNNLASVFTDNCGTCSTKHALLKMLADENGFGPIKLVVGLFKMNGNNTPEIAATLLKNNLGFIPEAHCYLRFGSQVIDVTKAHSKPEDFLDDLIEEIAILPSQITAHKVNYHKNYLASWLEENKQIGYSLNELWTIREQCIKDLSENQDADV